MAAELGTVRLGTLSGTLVLRLDDGSEVEVGRLDLPLNAHVGITMPARTAAQAEQDRDADRREADESPLIPEPPAPVPLDRERIDALPVGSVILDRDGDRYERREDAWYRTTHYRRPGVTLPHGVWYAELLDAFRPYTLVSMPEPVRPLPVGTKVRVIEDGVNVMELAGRTGAVIDPALRPDLGAGQVLVHIPSRESLRDDRAWSFDPERLAVVG